MTRTYLPPILPDSPTPLEMLEYVDEKNVYERVTSLSYEEYMKVTVKIAFPLEYVVMEFTIK